MSDTPRTDEEYRFNLFAWTPEAREFARQLERELHDYRESMKNAMDESCDANEKHCTCVPLLRARVGELERELVAMTDRAQKAERYATDMLQDTYEGAYVPTSLRDCLVQALSEVAPNHPALQAKPPSYGVWESLRNQLNAALAERDAARRAFDDIDLCKHGQAPCEWAMRLIAERDAARECLREAMKWILDNPYIDGLKKKWRDAAGLDGAK